MSEQTIWLVPRATSFVETCETCLEEAPAADAAAAGELRGSLARDRVAGWASCANGHRVRVRRMTVAMPAGAFR